MDVIEMNKNTNNIVWHGYMIIRIISNNTVINMLQKYCIYL